MNRNMIIGLVLAGVLVVGGGAAYVLTQTDSTNQDTSSQQSSKGDSNQSKTFNPNWSSDQSFIATLTTNGEQTGQIASDGQGAIQFTTTQDGQQMRFIYANDAYYACTGEKCIKYPLSQAPASAFDPQEYQYDETKIADLRNKASYKGQQSCSTGTCDVWEYAIEGTTTTLFIDTASQRIVQAKHVTANGQTTELVYEYKDVKIEIPANAQEINIPNLTR